MDKVEFVHSVNGLRDFESAVKRLYRSGTDVGQDWLAGKKNGFCTFNAVDMQTVFHSRVGFGLVAAALRRVGKPVEAVLQERWLVRE